MIKKKLILLGIIFLVLPIISAGTYGTGTYSSGAYTVGEVTATPTTPSGGGGGTATCTYNWECTNWFPTECPESRIQERVCANKGTCTKTLNIPNQTRECIYKGPTEPLFDIFLTIPKKYTEICAGKILRANVNLENYGKIELLDAFMTYWIIDQNNKLIAELRDTRAVKDQINFNVEIKTPKLTAPGTYRLYAQIDYAKNKTAVAGESFEILDEKSCKLYLKIPQYILFILAGTIILIIIIILILIIKKRRKDYPKVKKKKSIKKKREPKRKKEKEIKDHSEIKERKPVIKEKRQSKKERINPIKTIPNKTPKIKRISKSILKYPKSQLSKSPSKKQMFTKLLDDTVKLKKETKKRKSKGI